MTPELALALIVAAAATSQIIAARLGVPAIVPLLIAGCLMGPYVLDVFDPEQLFGELLTPMVSLAVGVILFEGGVELRARDLRHGAGRVVTRLVTLGVAVTWGLITAAAILVLDIDARVAVILGAILTLSGPTVVLPIVDFIRPTERLATILRWEGIIIDPIGAILAVLTYGAVVSGDTGSFEIGGFAATVFVGAVVGLVFGVILAAILGYERLSSSIKASAMLAVVFLSVAIASAIREDAGLVAAIALGISLTHIHKTALEESSKLFTQSLVTIIIGTVFIVLSATVDPKAVISLGWPALVFVALIILVFRPVSVALCTWGSRLTTPERAFLGGMMPRGIVAAATVAAFEKGLAKDGIPDAELLVPVAFLVIAVTVFVYGLSAKPYATALRVTVGRNRD